MGIFNDTKKLLDMSFSWALGAYTEPNRDLESLQYPPDRLELAVVVDEEGVVNVANELLLHKPTDPVDCPEVPEFTAENNFVKGLRGVIKEVPLYGMMLFPTQGLDGRVAVGEGVLIETAYTIGRNLVFPNDVPAGYVPCAGQLLRYADGREIVVPDLNPRTTIGGGGQDGSTQTTEYFAPPGTVWVIKVEEGWSEMVPDLNGVELRTLGGPTQTPGVIVI